MAKQLPARPLSMFSRVSRALRLMLFPEEFVAGAGFADGAQASQSFSASDSMSAMSAFPWVRACVVAIAEDLAGLPVVVTKNGERVNDGTIVDLLERPSSRVTWEIFLRQAVADQALSGNAYAVLVAGDTTAPSLLRMHPQFVRAVVGADGQIRAYRYNSETIYAWEDVMHVADISWSDDIDMVLGDGAIRSLKEDLNAELNAKRMAAAAAKRGRLEVIVSPSDAETPWSQDYIETLREAYTRQREVGDGAVFVGMGAKLDALSMSPREMEFSSMRTDTRDATLAAFQVPPSRVGLPTANYATQQQQMKTYWESLRGRSRLFSGALTSIARRIDPGSNVRVKFDFSEIESLQESRTEQLQRVQQWWLMGVPLRDAATLEGLKVDERVSLAPPPPTPAEPAKQHKGRLSVPRTEEARASRWRAFLEATHKPAQREIAIAVGRHLRGMAHRYSARLVATGHKALDSLSLEQVLDVRGESELLRRLMGPLYSEHMGASFGDVASLLGVDLSEEQLRDSQVLLVDAFVHDVGGQTAEAVRQIIESGLQDGQSVNEIQERLIGAVAFSPVRALRVARTEATRAVNRGAVLGYEQAQLEHGLTVGKQWLSARDSHVRDAHQDLDGQVVAADGYFTASSGQRARYPGDFSDPSLVVNCRCTTIPVIS